MQEGTSGERAGTNLCRAERAILVVVGVVGFFRHEMFNLTFPLAHNIFHFAGGVIALYGPGSEKARMARGVLV